MGDVPEPPVKHLTVRRCRRPSVCLLAAALLSHTRLGIIIIVLLLVIKVSVEMWWWRWWVEAGVSPAGVLPEAVATGQS